MRHIKLDVLLAQIFATDAGKNAKARLTRAHKKLAKMKHPKRKAHTDRNGPNKWKPIKELLTTLLDANKCWYTEVKLTGAPLVVDHYRPVSEYWWQAFDAENYRLACPWANSLKYNELYNRNGGKGDNFPLQPPNQRAKRKSQLDNEAPVLLDPCKKDDCKLLAFDTVGRPVLHPDFAGDVIAKHRIEESNILLNIDLKEFNSEREQLCLAIAADVRIHEGLPADSPERVVIRTRLREKLGAKAPYSTAAGFYMKQHRNLDWVEEILLNEGINT